MNASAERFQTTHWSLVAAGAVASYVAGKPWAWGIIVGGAAIGIPTGIYYLGLGFVLRGGRRRLAAGLAFAKVAATLALGWLALYGGAYRPDPTAFAIGVTCLPLAVVIEALRARKD